MIVSVLYPAKDGARFDFDYYRSHHAPMVNGAWNPQSSLFMKGLPGPDGSPAPYVLIAQFRFASPAEAMAALTGPKGPELRADIANFTDITPSIAFAEDL